MVKKNGIENIPYPGNFQNHNYFILELFSFNLSKTEKY